MSPDRHITHDRSRKLHARAEQINHTQDDIWRQLGEPTEEKIRKLAELIKGAEDTFGKVHVAFVLSTLEVAATDMRTREFDYHGARIESLVYIVNNPVFTEKKSVPSIAGFNDIVEHFISKGLLERQLLPYWEVKQNPNTSQLQLVNRNENIAGYHFSLVYYAAIVDLFRRAREARTKLQPLSR